MTHEEMHVFIKLKFDSIMNAFSAFSYATSLPRGVPRDRVMNMLELWIEQGAPKILSIPEGREEQYMVLKYGSVINAYLQWIRYADNHGLTEAEVKIVMDYADTHQSG